MVNEKTLMYEAATLYYEKKLTQQEIAGHMKLSRQTVSRLLNDAIREKIVEIRIHNPEENRKALEGRLCRTFGISRCVVCSTGSGDGELRRLMTVRAAVDYLLPAFQKGGLRIAVSWGRTVQEFIRTLPETPSVGSTVFPLFGATDSEKAYFSSNELARKLADKLGATLKCAWFPYMAESREEWALVKQLSCYRKMQEIWSTADIAILGIGNTDILEVFGETFGCSRIRSQVIGDIATNFFDRKGQFADLYENTLRASAADLRNAKETVAIACGDEKAEAIGAALRTRVIDTLITDELTARIILENC